MPTTTLGGIALHLSAIIGVAGGTAGTTDTITAGMVAGILLTTILRLTTGILVETAVGITESMFTVVNWLTDRLVGIETTMVLTSRTTIWPHAQVQTAMDRLPPTAMVTFMLRATAVTVATIRLLPVLQLVAMA